MATKKAVMALVKLMTLAKTMQEKTVIKFHGRETEHGFLPSQL